MILRTRTWGVVRACNKGAEHSDTSGKFHTLLSSGDTNYKWLIEGWIVFLSPNRFIARTWPYLKRSAGEIKLKFTRNKSSCKYWIMMMSCLTFTCLLFLPELEGELISPRPLIRLHNQPSPVTSSTLLYDSPKLRSDPGEKIIYKLPYPPDTKAFPYYFTSPENPSIAGELRFRVASSDDLASFKSGSDPWKEMVSYGRVGSPSGSGFHFIQDHPWPNLLWAIIPLHKLPQFGPVL